MSPRIAIVVGMKSEARIAASGPGLTIVGGGSAARVEGLLDQAGRLDAVLSFGVVGGLAPHLRSGDLLAPEAVLSHSAVYPCHVGWARSLARRLPGAHKGALLGVDEPIRTPEHKRRLHDETRAVAVDMESHGAARFAAKHGLPFAVLRAVSDPQHRAVPAAALAGFKADGSADVFAVLAALVRSPGQTASLVRTARDARAAFDALLGGRRLLGSLFGFDQIA
ncbi:phosphorylase [Rhodoblastus sp.]|uniref:phosphorylase family protein n=1 Tax=Rhodoblastus sp. TaxID=1962975 RepID=UPI00261E011B|nr:phosphorylase [Rhodoblastus sp.]